MAATNLPTDAAHIPAAVRKVMELFGWPEYVARRHIAQREGLARASYRAPILESRHA